MTPELDLDGIGRVEIGAVSAGPRWVDEDTEEGRVVASGRRAMRREREARRRRRRRNRVIIGVVVLWIGLLGWSFVSTFLASDRASQSVSALASRGLATTEANELRAVAGDLETARRRLGDPWVRPLELVPLLGRQIRAARTIDESALEAVRAGADAIEVLDEARSSSDQAALLQLARTELASARDRLARTVLPSSTLLVPPLVDARNRLGDQLVAIDDELGRFQAVADAFGSLAESDATYLIAASNTSEMGSGTGMMLSLGLLRLTDGEVVVSDFESVSLFGRGTGVQIPQEIRDRWFSLDPGHLFQYASHLSPRMDEVGRIVTEMWESVDQPEVDGVLVVNPVALEILLRASGAETVVIGDETYPVDVVGRFFGRLQYQLYEDTPERKELISPVAAQAFGSVFSRVADPQALVDGVYEAVEGRHLMAWAEDPEQQARWERLGMAGTLRSDSLLIGVLNAGGNKLDSFMEISSDVTWRATPQGTTVSVDITVDNTATGAEVSYIAGGGRRSAEPGEYVGYLTVNLPAGATRAEMTGYSETNAAGPDGPTHQLVHILELPPGETASYSLEFDLPPVFEVLTIEPSGRLPSIAWTVAGEPVADRRQTVPL